MAYDPSADDLDLAELARAANVSPRTVRYYIHQKLLPPPGTRGPGARYDRSLIDRLQLIKLLQKDGWPLGRIRDHLAELDDDGVRRELGEPPELPLEDRSALSYVRSVMHTPAPPMAVRASHDLFGGVAEQAPRAPRYQEPSKFEIRKSSWDRLRLGPNVELSTRTNLPPEQKKLVDRLIEAARQIFGEEQGP